MNEQDHSPEVEKVRGTFQQASSTREDAESKRTGQHATPCCTENNPPPFDYQRSVNRLGGDAVLFREIVELFLEDAPALLVQAHRSLGAGDAPTLGRSAHSLKGLAANLDALAVVSAAQSIEQYAEQHDLSLAGACLPELAKRLQVLQSALTSFLADDKAR